VVHRTHQLTLFNAHYDERYFLPIHIYHAANARTVVVLFRPGKMPSSAEIHAHVQRMVRRIRTHWPDTCITLRGDSHHERHEVMAWCEASGLRCIFGLSGNAVLDRMMEPLADNVRVRRAKAQAELIAFRPRRAGSLPTGRPARPPAPSPDCWAVATRPGPACRRRRIADVLRALVQTGQARWHAGSWCPARRGFSPPPRPRRCRSARA
jgi:hypothetical protein